MSPGAFGTSSGPGTVSFRLSGERITLSQEDALSLGLALVREANVMYVCARCSYPHGELSPAGRNRACPGCGAQGYATGSSITRGAARLQHEEWKATNKIQAEEAS